jgi:glutathione S-transferase
MGDLVLYGNHESGHSYKVRLFLTLAGVSHRYVRVDLDVPREARPEEFRRVSQFGEVPVLVAGGVPQAQSNALLLRLASETGSSVRRPGDPIPSGDGGGDPKILDDASPGPHVVRRRRKRP